MNTEEIAYFGLGAAVGAAVAILLAPKSGSETQRLLRSKAAAGGDYLASQATTARDTASDAIDRGKKAVKQTIDNLGSAVDAGVKSYRDTAHATR